MRGEKHLRAMILITGGGTGGHVYPALSVIRHLIAERDASSTSGPTMRHPSATRAGLKHDDAALAYVGSSRGLERDLVPRTGTPTYLFPMAAPQSPGAVALLAVATMRALALVLRLRPRATFATGGYVSIPAVVASWLARIPTVMFLPDVVPGRAVAWLVPLCTRIAVSTEDALHH